MSNDDRKSPMPNDKDKGKGLMFTAFQNLSLQSNNNHLEQGESSNNNNHNLNVHYNIGHISLQGSRLSAAGSRAPPSTPSRWITQPGASSSTNSGQPSASPQSFFSSRIDLAPESLCELLDMMKCPPRDSDSKFLGFLRSVDTEQAAERESLLLGIGTAVTTNHSTFLDLATNQNGSHALRALLNRSPGLDEIIFNAVCRNFRCLMISKYGHYLIIPTIRAVDKPRKEILFEHTYQNTVSLAVEETGCVALNDVFQEIRGTFRDLIFNLVAQNAGWLSFDPYGTHVVQNFLTLQNPRATQAITETLFGSFFTLATGRQGSYVVEKCLNSEFGRATVLEEFRGNDKEWVRMANDKFGNFVAQRALRVMKQRGMKQMLREFVDKLRPHFWEMRHGHGKNTLRLIEEEIEDYIFELPDYLLSFLS